MRKQRICWLNSFYYLIFLIESVVAVPKFEVTSVSTTSIVVKMVSATNVSRFEMDVTIFDLDRLREFRKTELSVGRHDDQLFSFDGLIPSTWFAIRIEYKLFFFSSDGGYSDFPTKQELIIRTKNNTLHSPSIIDDQIIFIDGVVTDQRNVNVTVDSVFAPSTRLSTLIVPELQCERGSIKPPAQRIANFTKIHFDLKKVIHHTNRFENPHCSILCIFPYIRAEIMDAGQQTFRGKEWCGSLQEALEQFPSISHGLSKTFLPSILLMCHLLFL